MVRRNGRTHASREDDEGLFPPVELGALYVGLGDKEAALDSLERGYREPDLQMQYLKIDPYYDDLRSDARFQDIMRKVGPQ